MFCPKFGAVGEQNLDKIGMWETIKKILQKNKGTCIIIEDNKPVYVVVNFTDYQRLLEKEESAQNKEEQTLTEVNTEIANLPALKDQDLTIEEQVDQLEEIKVEDIPL